MDLSLLMIEKSNILNETLVNVVSELNINAWKSDKPISNENDEITRALEMFSDQQAFLRLKIPSGKQMIFLLNTLLPLKF